MCFSAGASFGAGIVLSAIGAAAIQKAKGTSTIMFAAIPLVFAIQQIVEGVVWLSFTHPAYVHWREPAMYIFLFFAQVLWPTWVPLAILLMEKEPKRIRILKVLSGIGILTSACLAFCLCTLNVNVAAESRHISYIIDFPPVLITYGSAFYILVTVVPPFFSGIRKMWLLGAIILLSYLFTKLFFAGYVISVWCFFAAIISMVIYFILYAVHKRSSESHSGEMLLQ